jgi:hypothetical protein
VTRRKPLDRPITAGHRLTAELAKPDDPYSLTFLIEQAAHTADYLQRLRELLSGDRDAWLKVKIGAKTVEVVVSNPLVEARQLAEQMRRLLADIHRQRASISMGDEHDDDLAGLS